MSPTEHTFSIMNMSSADLTARARIRDAAIAAFGELGFAAATMRVIAERAGVSPALLVHHFGSKEGLRRACNDHVAQFNHSEKSRMLLTGDLPQMSAYLEEHPEARPMHDYLVQVLLEGGEGATRLFDRMADDLTALLAAGEDAGTVRAHPDAEARATVNTAFGLGMLVFRTQVARRLGGTDLFDAEVRERYGDYATHLYRHGLLTGAHPGAPADDPEGTP